MNFFYLFQEKIDREYQQQKTLEKPEVIEASHPRVSSSVATWSLNDRHEEAIHTIPPAPADVYPMTTGGEDNDPISQKRRERIKKVSPLPCFFCPFNCPVFKNFLIKL